METLENNIDANIIELEKRISAPVGFFSKLIKEDDWSFIIKLHALFEAACTNILVHYFKENNLTKIFSRLELSNKITGKIAFLSELGLINNNYRKLIYSLSELRNQCVHDIKYCDFNIKNMVNNFSDVELKRFAITYSPNETIFRESQFQFDKTKEHIKIMKKQSAIDNLIKSAKENPKMHIWLGAYCVLINIIDKYSYIDYINWKKANELLND